MYTIGIIGSPECHSTPTVRKVIENLYHQYGNTIKIATGGNTTGVENDVKKMTLEKDLKYEEYNPFYTPFNIHSVLLEEKYGKKWHPTHDIGRYRRLVDASSGLVVFTDGNKLINEVKKYAKKKGKKVIEIKIE